MTNLLLFIYAFFAIVLENMAIFTFDLASVLIKINKNDGKRGNKMNKFDKLGLQLFTIRNFMQTEEDVRESFQKMRKYGYTQAQTARCGVSSEVLARLAKEEGIEIVGIHTSFDAMLKNVEQVIEDTLTVGSTNMGIGGFHDFNSLDDVKRFIEQANDIAVKAAANGLKLTYHNHSHEFIRWGNNKTTMDMLVEGLDPNHTSFVLDTYWVQHGGADVRYWIEKLAGRIDILHLKDMKLIIVPDFVKPQRVQQMTEIGAGNMNWELIIESAKKSGVKYYVVEQDNSWSVNCFASIKASAEYLGKLMD